AAIPLPSLDVFPPEPSAGAPQAETVPLPPMRDVPEIGESAPFPPPRPPEFAMPGTPAAPERHLAQPNGATVRPAGPADNRNFLQRLFGLGLPPASVSGPAVASTAPESRGTGRVLLGAPFGASAPGSGYDRYTAVYDISART